MTEYSQEQVEDIVRKLTYRALRRLLNFKLVYDITRNQLEESWRTVEVRLHDRPVMGTGIMATLEGDTITGVGENEYFITDEPVTPEEIVTAFGEFPLDAAVCAYAFTVLEDYGDNVVAFVNPAHEEPRKAWHRDIFGQKAIRGGKKRQKMREAFGDAFGFEAEAMSDEIILNLMRIKAARNSFAHEGKSEMIFDEFIRLTVSVICYIGLINLPPGECFILTETDDHSGRFSNAHEYSKAIKEFYETDKGQ